MPTTIKWPPTPEGGRIPLVKGSEATRVSVLLTLSDLTQNPFNEDDLSLGDITFQPVSIARAKIMAALARLRRVAIVQSVMESPDNENEFIVRYMDLESREVVTHRV